MRIQPTLKLVALALAVVATTAADNPLRQLDELTAQWTSLQHQQDVLQNNWRTEKPVLEQQIDLLERESKALNDVIEQASKQQGQVDQKRLELLQQQTTFEQEQSALETSLARLISALHTLQPQLPPPLVKAWQDSGSKLDDTARTSSERLQLALDMLSQLTDFQQKLTLNDTVMMLADGQEHLVKQVFLGTAQGWYVTADGKRAAVGHADPAGWQWVETKRADDINRMIAILERKRSAELVSLPAQFKPMQGAAK